MYGRNRAAQSLIMFLFNFFMFAYFSLLYMPLPVGVVPDVIRFGKGIAGFLIMIAFFVIAAWMFTAFAYHSGRVFQEKFFQKKRIGDTFVSRGLITPDELAAALSTQNLRIGEILTKPIREADTRRDRDPGNYLKMGEMLIKIGFSVDDEIRWALSRNVKKITGILKEQKDITDAGTGAFWQNLWRPRWNRV